jgi:ATPase subunit of ABC transporter with duplicated ATPase domains
MSLVGNFTSNYDREAVSGGVPPPEMSGRRPSHYNDDQAAESDASTIAAADNSPPRSNNQYADNKEGSYNTQDADEVAETARREEAVHQLARRLTTQSQMSSANQNPFNAAPNSSLDPHGENFNARAWTKAMLNLQLNDENAPPVRTAGVSFRDLNVHGFGTDADYQKSVGNVWLDGPALIKKAMGDKGRKIEILKNCDGLVEAGEMLVVLGPPGSGCSTFLKTITGETHGFHVDSNSHINYQGTFAAVDCTVTLY